jgi:hypothetical protein
MPVLTVEAIEEDAWNAVAFELPETAERGLLNVAYRAVKGCLSLERELMLAAEIGWRIKPETGEAEYPPLYAQHKARWEQGCERLYLIADRYQHELHAYNEAQKAEPTEEVGLHENFDIGRALAATWDRIEEALARERALSAARRMILRSIQLRSVGKQQEA